LAPIIIGSVSCSEGESANKTSGEAAPEATAKTTNAERLKQTKPSYVLPSPMEIASLIQKTGINYTEVSNYFLAQ
jgi:hypothetical protein